MEQVNLLEVSNPKRLKNTLNQVLEDTAESNARVEELAADAVTTAQDAKTLATEANENSKDALNLADQAMGIATEAVDETNKLEIKVNGLNVEMAYDASTGVLGIALKDPDGNILSESSKDLPLELLISSGAYNPDTKEIVLTLANGDVLNIDVRGLIDTYLADEETLTLEGNVFKIKDEFKELISKTGIEQLVGTADEPINFNDLEIGKYYIINGLYLSYAGTSNTNGDILMYKYSATQVWFMNESANGKAVGAWKIWSINSSGVATGATHTTAVFANNSTSQTPISIYAPTTGGTRGQILQSNGGFAPTWVTPDFEHKLIKETYNISNWTTLSDTVPYTYSTTITATYTIGEDTEVELINDNAVLFAKYGFAIASVNGQEITIYSVTQPSENISLTIGFRG